MELAQTTLAAIILLTTLLLLVARRIRAAINGYAAQSIALGALAIVAFAVSGFFHLLVLGILSIAVKGIAIPMVLRRQISDTVYEKREMRYYVGVATALLIGAGLTVAGFLAASGIPFKRDTVVQPVLGVAIAVTVLGLFSCVARRDAVLQLVGLLAAENGVILVGLVISAELALLTEFAIFLDILIGVLVMGFLIVRMHETLTSTDTSELTRLRG